MAVAISAEDTLNTSGTTDHVLATKTQPGTYVLSVDLASMAATDIVELSIYTKIRSSGSSRLTYHAVYGPIPPAEPNVFSLPVPVAVEIVCKLKKAVGSSSAFPWALLLL